ncbi:hypothetical protein EX30DRAFT_91628 [Ascodesmis nigricans]|uniref:HOOK N-terminal domain-containing protein n=1 Tax=Ascodesmis nigricans TaxID=341454 RepID=A0A4S2N3I2_9PEZI|nr:hypothetical protein EX30DRAFT_91628 [Ascodesmis nigricans]
MTSGGATAQALVEWINSFPIEPKISSLAELYDGSIIAKILLDIDPHEFRSSASPSEISSGPGPTTWATNFGRLKRLHKALVKYYTEVLEHRLPASPPSLTSIAKDQNVEETIKLLKIVVAAAAHSGRKEHYIAGMQKLSAPAQTEIMKVLSEMMALDEQDDSEEDTGRGREDDAEHFRMEEEMGRLLAEKDAAENRAEFLERRLSVLQNDFDDTSHQLMHLQDIMARGGSADGYGGGNQILRSQIDTLQSEVQKLEDIVAERENTISSHENVIASLRRQVDDLVPKSEAGLRYKDELDEANHTIERLRKSQNIAEKYRKKLESMGDLERQVKNLERQNAQLLQDLRSSEENSKLVPGLKRTIDQYKKQTEKIESDLAGVLRNRHLVEAEKEMLREKAAGAESQKNKDMERIHALEERIRELENGVITAATHEGNGDLDSELTYTEKTKTDLKLQIARLEDEVAAARDHGGPSPDAVMLQHLLEDATKAKEKLEHDYLQASSDRAILEAQVNDLLSGNLNENSQSMLALRSALTEAHTALSELKAREQSYLADLASLRHQLSSLESDLSLVDTDKVTALAKLKESANSELIEFKTQYTNLESQLKDTQLELTQKQSLLNKILLEKDEISNKMSQKKDELHEKDQALSELKITLATLQGAVEGGENALERRCAALQNKLEERRERMTKYKEHIKKLNAIVRELKEKLDAAMKADADERLEGVEMQLEDAKRQRDDELALLERENALMATAWHDQSSRLQMNSVTLLRRGLDAPRSWLNKQRTAVYSSMVRGKVH